MQNAGFSALVGLAATIACAATAITSHAEEAFPSRVVKIVVPAAGGSTTDAVARLLADELSKKWGKSVIVENIAGGAMNIGATSVARSAPDGHTLMLAPPAPLSFNDLLYKDLNYVPTAFVPITLVATVPNVLDVNKDLPINSIKDLVAYGKANPGKLSYGSQGAGSTAHLTASQLEVLGGIKMVHVPYRGAQFALTDVIAGHISIFFDTPTTSIPLFRDGKLKILGVADVKRLAALPDVPTIAEAGIPGFRSITWFGMVAPPQTPAAIADKINRDTVEILKTKEISEKLHGFSLDVSATSRAEATKFFADETALWSNVIKEAGITPQ